VPPVRCRSRRSKRARATLRLRGTTNNSISHARTVVRECCKGDDESQWERGQFDPPPPKNPLTDGHQNSLADLGVVRGVRPHPPWRPSEKFMSTNFENSEDSRQHDYYYYQFYLAASSHEIFLRVGGREGMKGLAALQRHQLPHPPCKKSWIRHCQNLCR